MVARAPSGSGGRGASCPSSGRADVIRATEADLAAASSILTEAAQWLIDRGEPLWRPRDLVPARIRGSVDDGSLHLAWRAGEPVGTIAFTFDDPVIWPHVPRGESAFVHRLAVRRAVAGTGVAAAMLAWAEERAANAGRRWLRLDCSARHAGLAAYYRAAGFTECGTSEVASYRGVLFERRVPEMESAS